MSKKAPWWHPVLTDEDYCARLREDYPEDAHMSDEDLVEEYNDGLKYDCLWDHIGDAYEQFEPMADAFLMMLEALEPFVEIYERFIGGEADDNQNRTISIPVKVFRRARAALSKATEGE